jgi:hypothetical protein
MAVMEPVRAAPVVTSKAAVWKLASDAITVSECEPAASVMEVDQ